MPNTKSAQKRQRSNEAKTARNTTAKSRVRTLEKNSAPSPLMATKTVPPLR